MARSLIHRVHEVLGEIPPPGRGLESLQQPFSSITRQSVKVLPTSTQTRFVFADIGSSSSVLAIKSASDKTRSQGKKNI
jgi:hypothetical protein